MKRFFSFLILFMAAVTASSQTVRKAVVWSGEKQCGFKNKSVSSQDQVECGTIMTARGPVSTISLNGVDLGVAFLDNDDYMIVSALIRNSTQDFVSFDSDLWGAAHFKTKAGYYAGEKPIIAETSVPSRDIMRRLAVESKMQSSMDDMMSDGQKSMETREYIRSDGVRVKTNVIVTDKEAKATAARSDINRKASTSNEQQKLRSTALTAKSVAAGNSVKGLVYFRRIKKAEFTIFSFVVGDATFVFQLPRTKK